MIIVRGIARRMEYEEVSRETEIVAKCGAKNTWEMLDTVSEKVNGPVMSLIFLLILGYLGNGARTYEYTKTETPRFPSEFLYSFRVSLT